MAVRTFNGLTPDISRAAYVDDTAVVIGDVFIGEGASVWPLVVLRGDVSGIEIGELSNIQDSSVLHTNIHLPVRIGKNVTVGHGAILHGCTIGDRCLIGMGSVILDGAVIPDDTIVGASALVTEGTQLESGGLYVGIPARRARSLRPEDKELIMRRSLDYLELSKHYAKEEK
ncbi:MAG: gamma carbonic anhydrase family protein [Elusimicrobia bacterium]|nr:gamma carbonic anhydrase family protein [Elusimicrobiota bacterium]